MITRERQRQSRHTHDMHTHKREYTHANTHAHTHARRHAYTHTHKKKHRTQPASLTRSRLWRPVSSLPRTPAPPSTRRTQSPEPSTGLTAPRPPSRRETRSWHRPAWERSRPTPEGPSAPSVPAALSTAERRRPIRPRLRRRGRPQHPSFHSRRRVTGGGGGGGTISCGLP